MKTRVQQWGNSLALRIPKSFAREAGIEKSTDIDLTMEDGRLVITPVEKHGVTLDMMLSRITEDNIHGEIETGTSVGNESW